MKKDEWVKRLKRVVIICIKNILSYKLPLKTKMFITDLRTLLYNKNQSTNNLIVLTQI